VGNKPHKSMKKIFPIILILSIAVMSATIAQDKTTPRTEYTVSLSEKVVNLKPGETKQLTVFLLKSKSYIHSKAKLGLSSTLPEGITVAFEPAEGLFDSSEASISATPTAKEGEYQIIIKTTINNKIKGSIVKVVVGSDLEKAITAN
jgi:hypothetical protein